MEALMKNAQESGTRARMILSCLLLLLMASSSYAQFPSLLKDNDILIWDEQYLRGVPKGWKVPSDYHEAFSRGQAISNDIRFGRFGLFSGSFLYTTWRPIKPLSDEVFAEGKTAIYDNHVSELLTPPFEIQLDYVTFLLSGGNMPGEACVNLLVDGEVVRTATGRNEDLLESVAFDVRSLRGKEARFQVLDTSTAQFGYVTVDCIRQSPDPRSAVRVISNQPPAVSTNGHANILSGRIKGKVEIKTDRLLVGGRHVELKDLLLLDTGVPANGDVSGKRIELTGGDILPADVLALEDGKLRIEHAVLDELNLPLSKLAMAAFQPGPTVKADPGVLIHSAGNKIPGELLWIRDDNIAIKCSLGVVPLPRARVRAYVFGKSTNNTTATSTVVLVDGSVLYGTLSLDEQGLLLTHETLGPIQLTITDIARISRNLQGVTRLADLKREVREQVGPIRPPLPALVRCESGDALRIFPRTVVRYKLPSTTNFRRLRATLAPVPNSREPMTVQVRAGSTSKNFSVVPNTADVEVDIDLGRASEIEISVDSSGTISYPCGVEWQSAFITEDRRP